MSGTLGSNWDLAWVAIKKYQMAEKKRRKLEAENNHPGNHLQNLRDAVENNPSCENIEALCQEEYKIRALEITDAARTRRKSRVHWLSLGEALTKYFFKQLRANQARESIKMLKLSSGEVTEDQERILEEIFCFYAELSRL